MLEFLFELFGELLLQLVIEGLAEYGLRPFAEPFRQRPRPWLASIGYLLFGLIAGGLSLLLFPHNFIHHPALRMLNVFLSPVLAGGAMVALGRWRVRRGQATTGLDRFTYAFLFAIGLAAVRYFFAG